MASTKRKLDPQKEAKISPWLSESDYEVKSEATDSYNCASWALEITNRKWWPNARSKGYHWPINEHKETLDAFVEVYGTFGYTQCENATLEEGFEKLAIYTKQGIPVHVARQLANGIWTSKCGWNWEDIEHELDDIKDLMYGTVEIYMKRGRKLAADKA